MSSVFVKSFEDDDRLLISLDLKIQKESGASSIKTFNLNRLKHEELGLAVERLRLNLSKKVNKKSKQKKTAKATNDSEASIESQSDLVPIEVIHNGQVLDLSISNKEAWVDGAVLKVWEEEIAVCYNPPSVKLEKLPNTIMVGFPLFPEVEYEFTNVKNCEFYWKLFDEKHLHKVMLDIKQGNIDLTDAVIAHSFTPQHKDIGRHVLMACLPKNNDKVGRLEVILSTNAITAGPGLCPFEKRSEFTKQSSKEGEFRVLTYNLLAQVYADTDLARQELFSYCPKHALEMDYRKHLLLKEIIGYQADLLCLQEVDKSIFGSQLMPAMQALGYTGLFRAKDGGTSEGCATFISERKFRVVKQLDVSLSPFLATDPLCADIWSEVCKSQTLKEKIEQRSTILQVTVAESAEKSGSYVCIANTHLYFHPQACNIRLVHAAGALRYLQNICDTYTLERPSPGYYQLLTAQYIPSDHADWNSGGSEELISGLELHQPMNIESACGTPPYTNFTRGFQETLDYIFIDSDKLQVTQIVPMPSHEDVTANIALPSIVFPSDHLALICDLKFKS
ncbi:unnamed protein product [Candidula unifasciata]|uniref:2',5'-phosphodiesterase 12-like N-terminal domain-containing protein n=1 Tax=Candidula unifasciata TaxID=100452 RepID=A0A8S4A857_9EUPU|nr:unnamed protein product [Candidula unifasciata]